MVRSETRNYTAWEADGISTRIETIAMDGTTATTSFSSHLDGKEGDTRTDTRVYDKQ